MKIPVRLIEFLNQNQVRYEIVHHPVAFTAQELLCGKRNRVMHNFVAHLVLV